MRIAIAEASRFPDLATSVFGMGRERALGVKQTSLVRDRVSVNDPRVDLEENRHGVSNSTFPAKNYGSPCSSN